MKKLWIIWTLPFLTACAASSTPEPARPPEYLLERAEPLPRPTVDTTRDLVRRTLAAETAYDGLAERHNILIDWFEQEDS